MIHAEIESTKLNCLIVVTIDCQKSNCDQSILLKLIRFGYFHVRS